MSIKLVNQVTVSGHLANNPKFSYKKKDGKGQKVSFCRFALAVNRQPGPNQPADFITCFAWDEMAENISKSFQKNQLVTVAGRLENFQFIDKETQKTFSMLGIHLDSVTPKRRGER